MPKSLRWWWPSQSWQRALGLPLSLSRTCACYTKSKLYSPSSLHPTLSSIPPLPTVYNNKHLVTWLHKRMKFIQSFIQRIIRDRWLRRLSQEHWAQGAPHTHSFTTGGNLTQPVHLPACFWIVGENQRTQRKPMQTRTCGTRTGDLAAADLCSRWSFA